MVLGGCMAIILLSVGLCLPDGETVSLDAAGQFPVGKPCLFRQLVGLNCPSCGLTRSFISCGHFLPGPAWSYNPVGPVLWTFVLLQIPYRILRLAWPDLEKRTDRHDLRANLGLLITFAGLLIVNWLVYLIALIARAIL